MPCSDMFIPFPNVPCGSDCRSHRRRPSRYENSQLYRDIENLFDGFVNAAVKAIEQRDPTTSGHSQRVCQMTLALAEAVDREPQGPYADLRFSREQMKELRYAALLHDFGKVGVREEVLVKAKKLYPLQFSRLLDRFDYIRRDIEARIAEQKVEVLLGHFRKEAEARVRLKLLDGEASRLPRRIGPLCRIHRTSERADDPAIERVRFARRRSPRRPTATRAEPSAPTSLQRKSDTFRYRAAVSTRTSGAKSNRTLPTVSIFWRKFLGHTEYRGIPEIARAHHEKLNGRGYPNGLTAPEIPVQAKMMTICDIFDALSASDRPYKRAVPTDRALDILKLCVRDEEIDPELFRLFLDAQVYRLVSKPA